MVSATVASVTSGQARFDLVLGPRGAGKSHLLGLVEGRLRVALKGSAVVAGLPEDLDLSSLVHLLAELLRALPADPEPGLLARQLAVLAEHPPTEARERAVGMIRSQLRGLPLVIIIENLDIVFAAIGREGQHQLRSILQTERNWSIVATSRSLSPAFSKESEPFYGTFVARTLGPLSAAECRELLVLLAHASGSEELARELGTTGGLARVHTLRHVLGSYPRAMAFIFPHLHHDEPDMVEQALHELAEDLTPYFQEQMGRLSAGQRPIVQLLAESWTPLSVSEIARATFNAPATTSTHLKYLREDVIVRSTKLGREHFYELADPMFRIARAMKRNNLRATTFLRVLQGWYEFRGIDLWQLSPGVQEGLRTLPDLTSQYTNKRIVPLLGKLMRRRFRQVLDDIAKIDVDDPMLVALRIVALERLGEQEEAIAALSTGGSFKILPLASCVCSIEMTLAGCKSPIAYLVSDRGSSLGRLVVAAMAIVSALASGERAPLPNAVSVLESLFRSPSATIRNVATEIVVELSIPFGLARAQEHELCGRLIEILEPIGSTALSFNLAGAAMQAWATGRISDAFHRRSGGAHALSRGLGALAQLGLLLVTHEDDRPVAAAHEIPAVFEAFFSRLKLGIGALDLSERGWALLINVLIIRDSELGAMLPKLEEMLLEESPEARIWWASALHTGILHWIAIGRDLTPIASALALDRRMFASVGSASTIVPGFNPDLAYVRLAAPERAVVRQIAQAFGLEERHDALRKLSRDEL